MRENRLHAALTPANFCPVLEFQNAMASSLVKDALKMGYQLDEVQEVVQK